MMDRLQGPQPSAEDDPDGADAIVLACTEIQLLVGADDSPVPVTRKNSSNPH